MPVTRKWKLQWSGSKSNQQNFTWQGYMLSFESETLLLREAVTMLSCRDVIHRKPVSIWFMINTTVKVIIPVLKKRHYFLTHLRVMKKRLHKYICKGCFFVLFSLSFFLAFCFCFFYVDCLLVFFLFFCCCFFLFFFILLLHVHIFWQGNVRKFFSAKTCLKKN